MSQELFYTSAPQGLKPGSRGFCTVGATANMPKQLADRLEALSAYRHLFSPNDPNADRNPVVYSHLRLVIAGVPYHVLSKICAAGLDYSQRSNKFAHHVALDPQELVAAGPAELLLHPGFMESQWAGEPRTIPVGRIPTSIVSSLKICQNWKKVSGDAGWGGRLAETAMGNLRRNAVIVVKPGINVLELVAESLRLLAPPLRWQTTFSTYYTTLPPDVECQWRFVLAGSPEATALARSTQIELIDLTRKTGIPPGGPLVEAARTGLLPKPLIDEQQLAILSEESAVSPKNASTPSRHERRVINAPSITSSLTDQLVTRTKPSVTMPATPIGARRFHRVPAQKSQRWRVVLGSCIAVGCALTVIGALFVCLPQISTYANRLLDGAGSDKKTSAHANSPVPEVKHNEDSSVGADDKSSLTGNEGDLAKKQVDDKPTVVSAPQPSANERTNLEERASPTSSDEGKAQQSVVGAKAQPEPQRRPLQGSATQPLVEVLQTIDLGTTSTGTVLAERANPVSVVELNGVQPPHLRLIGGDRVDDKFTFVLQSPTSDAGNAIANIELHQKAVSQLAQPSRIARLMWNQPMLEFSWNENLSKTNQPWAEQLRNCVLEVDGVNSHKVIALRSPRVATTPLTVEWGMSKKSVSLGLYPWPAWQLELKLDDNGSNQGYSISYPSKNTARLQHSNPLMPTFVVSINATNKRVEFIFDTSIKELMEHDKDWLTKYFNTDLPAAHKSLELKLKTLNDDANRESKVSAERTDDGGTGERANAIRNQLADIESKSEVIGKCLQFADRTIDYEVSMDVEGNHVVLVKSPTNSMAGR